MTSFCADPDADLTIFDGQVRRGRHPVRDAAGAGEPLEVFSRARAL